MNLIILLYLVSNLRIYKNGKKKMKIFTKILITINNNNNDNNTYTNNNNLLLIRKFFLNCELFKSLISRMVSTHPQIEVIFLVLNFLGVKHFKGFLHIKILKMTCFMVFECLTKPINPDFPCSNSHFNPD